jgi:uncharacterized membrane protein
MWHLYFMAALYIIAGINHFYKPQMYERIIPPFLGNVKTLNILAGIAEITLGIILLFEDYRTYAAWGIMALLIAIFPANIYMLLNKKAQLGLPYSVLTLRLPLQILLIYWAYIYI